MHTLQAVKRSVYVLSGIIILMLMLMFSKTVNADHAFCRDGTRVPESTTSATDAADYCQEQTGSRVVTDDQGSASLDPECRDLSDCEFIGYVRDAINILSAIVGIVVVIMVAVGGIQYTTSRDNPQATAAAKQRIINAVIALVVYLFLFGLLEWFVPGGVFG